MRFQLRFHALAKAMAAVPMLALLLVAGSVHGAIALVVVPDAAFDAPGNGGSIHPFGSTADCNDGMRFQQILDGDAVGSGNISSLAFRLDDGEPAFGPHTYGGTTVKLSTTSRGTGDMSKTFADNIGADETLVFQGDLTVSAGTDTPVNPFDFQLPVDVPFHFDASSGNLLIDVTVEDCPLGADGVFFDGDSRDLAREYAYNKNANTAESSTGAGGLVTEVVLSTPPPLPPLYSCAFSGTGDGLDRGFYVDNFPAKRLDDVTLGYRANGAGTYIVELTAREHTYDGRLIGKRRVEFTGSGGGTDEIPKTYDFGGATVTEGETVTFSQEIIERPSGSSLFYDIGDPSGCTDIIQTQGTSPPLDSSRSDSVGLEINSVSRLRGLGGNWTVVGHNGEGFMIHVTDRKQLVAIWFTYDDAGNQMWLIGVADNFDGNQATMTVDEVTGPVFGPDFDSTDVVTEQWGTLSFSFNDCRSGTVHYNSTTGFGSGVYDISKIYDTEQQMCP